MTARASNCEPPSAPDGAEDAWPDSLPYSVDEFVGGALRLRQPLPGCGATRARVTSDSFWLADFSRRRLNRPRSMLELGAGHAALSLLVAHARPIQRLVALEQDSELARAARFNLRASNVCAEVIASRVQHCAEHLSGEDFDLVVTNPPYLEPGTGRAPEHDRTAAHAGPLSAFLSAASQLCSRNTRLHLCYPASGLERLLSEAWSLGLHPKQLRFVHPRPNAPARLLLAELRRTKPGGLEVLAPGFEWTHHERPQQTEEFSALSRQLVP